MDLSLGRFLGVKRRARRLLSSPDGERFLAWLKFQCRPHKTTWEGDPMQMGVYEGKRQVWLAVQELINLSDEKVAQLMMEQGENE